MNGDGIMTDKQEKIGDGVVKPKSKLSKIIIGIVIVLAAIAAFYLLYWVKTPQHSLGIIKDAVEKHDLITFEKHVNLQNIGTQAIDDMIATTIPAEEMKTPAVAGIINMVKAAAVPAFVVQAQKYVTTGSFSKLNAQNDGQVMVASAAERTGLTSMKFKGIASTSRNKTEAIVTINVWDQQLDQNFVLRLQMQQLGDGTWCLTEIANLKDFIAERDKVVEKRLAALNKPIQDKIKAKVQLITSGSGSMSIERLNKDKESVIKAWIPFKLLAANIKSVSGTLLIFNKDKKVIFSRDFTSGDIDLSKSKDGLWHFNNSWVLNSYDSGDKEISSCDLATTTSQVVFTALHFNDDTKAIECYNILPAK